MFFNKKQKKVPFEFNSNNNSLNGKKGKKTKNPSTKFRFISLFKKSKKNSIFKKIVFTCSSILVVSLLSSSVISYFITKDKVQKDFESSAKQLLLQNKNYIDLFSETIEATSLQILSDRDLIRDLSKTNGTDYERFEATRERQKKITNLTSLGSNPLINSITIYNESGNSVTSLSSVGISAEKIEALKKESWYEATKKASGKALWLPLHEDTILEGNVAKQYISNVRLLVSDIGNEAGILKINMAPDRLYEKLGNITLGETGYIKVVDANGYVISDKDGVTPGAKETNDYLEKIQAKESDSFTSTVDGKKMFITYETSQTTGWKFVALIPAKELYATATSIGLINSLIIFVFLLVSVAITAFVSKQISKPLEKVVLGTRELASGNFAVSLEESNIKEVDELSHNFNEMVNGLKDILSATKDLSSESTDAAFKLQEISQTLRDASEATTQTVNSIADGSFKQTEEVTYCVDFTKQFNEEIGLTIDHINAIQDTTNNTLSVIEEKSKVISELKESSSENKETIEMVALTIDKLGDNTKDILTILKNINDITDRTNLLSLNAAIEAARAGEAGRGFAVVADEVRKLAEQSKQSADEIKKIISNIQKSIQESVNITKKATVNFEGEYVKVDNTIEAFNIIRGSFDTILKMVEESSGSISKLEKDKDILIKSIDSISSISQDNSAATEEVSATMEEQTASNSEVFLLATNLTEKSKELNNIIDKFKL